MGMALVMATLCRNSLRTFSPSAFRLTANVVACLAVLLQAIAPSWAQSSEHLDLRSLICAPGGLDAQTASEAEELLKSFFGDEPQEEGQFEHCPDCMLAQHVVPPTIPKLVQPPRISYTDIERPALYKGSFSTRGPPLGERAPPSYS